MRTKLVVGNWKMNTDRASSAALAGAVAAGLGGDVAGVDVALCPPFVFLPIVGDALDGSIVGLGAQDVHDKPDGAYTGEISVQMLASVGCSYVIVGHSERRLNFGESDYDAGSKANAVASGGLTPIICVGETITEREEGHTNDILRRQVRTALFGVFEFDVRRCVIAYEPIWAIGTGNTATPEQAQDAHAYIRLLLGEMYDEAAADVRIIYGGSVNAANAAALFAQPDIDGALVGGASLDAASFLTIVRAA